MLTFVIVVIVAVYLYNFSKRLKQIEARLGMVNNPVIASQPAQNVAQPQSVTQESVAPKTVTLESAQKLPSQTHNGLNSDLSKISGNQWFTIIGVLALIFGIGFFLKFAIDQGWISPIMRVALGVVVGLLLVILGEIWREKYAHYARALSGGGLAILYFCVYAAFQFYQLITQPTAFIFAIIVTVLGIFLAYRYESKGLAVLALIGGYLSPLMLSNGQGSQVGLFIYLSVLNLGVLGMLSKDFWLEVIYISLFGTAFNFGAWFLAFSNNANTFNSMVFLLLNFFVVLLTTLIIYKKHIIEQKESHQTSQYLAGWQVLLGAGLAIATSALLYSNFHSYLGLVGLLISVVYFMGYVLVDRLENRFVNYVLSFVGSAFLVGACIWQFSGTTLSLYLLLAAILGIGVGIGMQRKEIRTWGVVILMAAAVQIFSTDYDLKIYQFFTNTKFALEVLVIAAFFAGAYVYSKLKNNLEADEYVITPLLGGLASGMLWLAVSWEIVTNFRDIAMQNTSNLSLSVWWMAYAVILGIASGAAKSSIIRKISVGLFIMTILKVFLYDVQALDIGYRIVSFITLGVILLAVSFVYQKNKTRIREFLEVSK